MPVALRLGAVELRLLLDRDPYRPRFALLAEGRTRDLKPPRTLSSNWTKKSAREMRPALPVQST